MRKLLVFISCLVFLFCGCSKDEKPAYEIDETQIVASGSSQSPSVDSTITSSPEPTPTVTPSPVIKYDASFKANVQKKVKANTYISVSQTIETKNFNSDETEGRTDKSLLLTVSADTKNLIVNMDSSLGLGEDSDSTWNIKSDFKNHIFYEKEGTGKWVKSTKGSKVFAGFEEAKLKDIWFVYNTLVNVPENEVTGEIIDGVQTFKTQRDAQKSDLSADSKYDKLLTTEIIHTYKDFVPIQVEKATNFILNDKTYTVSTIIKVEELSKKQLPNLKKGVK